MFIDKFTDLHSAYSGHYDLQLVLLSVLVASLAAYVAISISHKLRRVKMLSARLWCSWWLTGSLVMGLGVWSMHFVGMLAFKLPFPVSYDLQITLISIIPAVLASTFVMKVDPDSSQSQASQWITAGVMGAGIGLMHYSGVAAMRTNALMMYDPAWFAASIIMAVVLSYITLRIKWKIEAIKQHRNLSNLVLLGPSLAMGISMTAIHYTAMFATRFFPDPTAQIPPGQELLFPDLLSWVLAGAVASISFLLFAAVQLSDRLERATLIEERADNARGILDSSTDGIITIDDLGQISSFNVVAERLFGYKAEHVIGRNILFLLPETTRKMLEEIMLGSKLNVPGIINHTRELVACRSNGTEFPVELTVRPIREHGMQGFVGMVRDISARKQAEVDRQKSQDRLEFLLQASPIVIYTCSVTGSFPVSYVSPNVKKLFGFEPEAITATAAFWPQQIHPEDLDRIRLERQALRKEGHDHLEYRLKLPDGSYRWISDIRTKSCDESGKPQLLIGTWGDIHEKKVAELSRALNEERLRISLKCANMATWDWDIQTGEVMWSEDMTERLGFADGLEASFDNFLDIVHPEDLASVEAAFRQSLVRGQAFDHEYRVVWPDRSIHWVHSLGGLINDEDGNPMRMVGVLYEITEQKQLRVAPQASAELA